MKTSFPIYILELGGERRIVASEGRVDIAHAEFWEETVAAIVASHYKLPLSKLKDLPYSQKRARVQGDSVCYGEEHEPGLLEEIRQALQDENLVFVESEAHRRWDDEVVQFEKHLKDREEV